MSEPEEPLRNYEPTSEDVVAVKQFFLEKYALPVELLDAIIDYAEYWPHTTTRLTHKATITSGGRHENQMLLRSYPVGFQPSDDDTDPGQLLPSYENMYQTMEPKPWPPGREVPSDATDEVLNYWGAKSLPRNKHPVRKIVFTIKSHDQGWGGTRNQKGTYNGSYTWFDVGLERMSACREAEYLSPLLLAGTKTMEAYELAPAPQFRLFCDLDDSMNPDSNSSLVCSLQTIDPVTRDLVDPEWGYVFDFQINPSDMHLQRNITASRTTKEHVIVWSDRDDISNFESVEALALDSMGRGRASGSGEFVRNLKMGDVVTVWGKARFPGWTNSVEDLQIDVYWAV